MGLLSNKISKEELQPGDHIYSWRKGYVYSHHGIFENDGKVIHFVRKKNAEASSSSSTTSIIDEIAYTMINWSQSISPASVNSLNIFECICPKCGDQSDLSGVIISCLECFLEGRELYRFEYEVPPTFFLGKFRGGCCSMIERDRAEEVLHRANYLHQNKGFGGYSLFENNCEDFAIYCMTGRLAFKNNKPVPNSTQTATVKAICDSLPSLLTDKKATAVFTYFSNRWKSDLKNMEDVRKIPVEDLFNYFKH